MEHRMNMEKDTKLCSMKVRKDLVIYGGRDGCQRD